MSEMVRKLEKVKTERRSFQKGLAEFKKQKFLQAMVIPGIIFILIFHYIPIYGLIIAFKDYSFSQGIWGSPWAGFKHFKEFLITPNLGNIFYNTLGISISRLIIGFPVPIIFALLLNELESIKFKKVIQTVSYLPHFISFVVIAGFMSTIFASGGVINDILLKLGIIDEAILFLGEEDYFWGMIVGSGIWQGMGWSSIIYLAAIAGVDQEMYEAATIDGAKKLQKVWYITLPAILPIVTIQLIMSMNTILNAGFDNILLLQNSMVMKRAEVLDTFVYKVGLQDGRYSFSTAVGLLTSVVRISLVCLTNWITKRLSGYGIF